MYVDNEEFIGLNIAEETISDREYVDCRFENCTFEALTLAYCRFTDCVFNKAKRNWTYERKYRF